MKHLILISIFMLSTNVFSSECSKGLKKKLKNKPADLIECQIVEGIGANKDEKHIIVVKDEAVGRGVGVEVYLESNPEKVLFEKYGLGQMLGELLLGSNKSKLFVRDIDKDGVNEFGLNVLNERTALFFLFHFDKNEKNFKRVDFKRKVKGEIQTINRLVSSIDFPIQILSDEIKVHYEKDKFFTYKLIDGRYFSDMDK